MMINLISSYDQFKQVGIYNNLHNSNFIQPTSTYTNPFTPSLTYDKNTTKFLTDFKSNFSDLYTQSTKLNARHAQNVYKSIDKVESETKQFIKDFNDSLDLLSSKKDSNHKVDILHQSLLGVSKTNSASLAEIGIKVESDGKFSLDEAKFKEALSTNFDTVKDTLTKVSDKAGNSAMQALSASHASLISSPTNNVMSVISQEDYYASIRPMASNQQFMNVYYSANAALGMLMDFSI